jgi:hypothetical protein
MWASATLSLTNGDLSDVDNHMTVTPSVTEEKGFGYAQPNKWGFVGY